MQFELVSNMGKRLSRILFEEIPGSEQVDIAVAYIDSKALKALSKMLDPIPKVRILTGTDYYLSDLEALAKTKYKIRAMSEWGFHPKIYIFRKARPTAVIGSSNLTAGGLWANIESNLVVREKEAVDQAIELFEKLWSNKLAMELDQKFLEDYIQKYTQREQSDKELFS